MGKNHEKDGNRNGRNGHNQKEIKLEETIKNLKFQHLSGSPPESRVAILGNAIIKPGSFKYIPGKGANDLCRITTWKKGARVRHTAVPHEDIRSLLMDHISEDPKDEGKSVWVEDRQVEVTITPVKDKFGNLVAREPLRNMICFIPKGFEEYFKEGEGRLVALYHEDGKLGCTMYPISASLLQGMSLKGKKDIPYLVQVGKTSWTIWEFLSLRLQKFLQVDEMSTPAQITKAYRARQLEIHPDGVERKAKEAGVELSAKVLQVIQVMQENSSALNIAYEKAMNIAKKRYPSLSKEEPKVETKPEVPPKEEPKVETKPEVPPKEEPKVETKPEIPPKEEPKVETKPEIPPKEEPISLRESPVDKPARSRERKRKVKLPAKLSVSKLAEICDVSLEELAEQFGPSFLSPTKTVSKKNAVEAYHLFKG